MIESLSRRRSVAFLSAVLLVLSLSACVQALVTPPATVGASGSPICLPHPPASAADYQAVFSTRGPRWAGGDGANPVALPDGRTLWTFGDTLGGGVQSTGRLVSPWALVHSSLLVQSGSCFSVVMRGTAAHPTAVIPPTASGHYFWPSQGYFDPVVNRVVVQAFEVATDPTGPPGWQWKVTNMAEVFLSWPGLTVLGTAPLPFPIAADGPLYGATTLVDGGQVYAYGASAAGQFVARASLGHSSAGPWQYWSTNGWVASAGAAAPMPVSGAASVSPWTVIHQAGGYLAAGKTWDVVSDDVSAWSGPSPAGPWTYAGRLATTPTTNGVFSYGGRVESLPGAGLVVMFSTNASLDAVVGNVLLYGPHALPYVAPVTADATVARLVAPRASVPPMGLLPSVGHTTPGG